MCVSLYCCLLFLYIGKTCALWLTDKQFWILISRNIKMDNYGDGYKHTVNWTMWSSIILGPNMGMQMVIPEGHVMNDVNVNIKRPRMRLMTLGAQASQSMRCIWWTLKIKIHWCNTGLMNNSTLGRGGHGFRQGHVGQRAKQGRNLKMFIRKVLPQLHSCSTSTNSNRLNAFFTWKWLDMTPTPPPPPPQSPPPPPPPPSPPPPPPP